MAVIVIASAEITLTKVIDIKASYRYYLLQGSTLSKPSKPVIFPPPTTWDDSEPSYVEGSTNSLYFVDCTVFCDDSYTYSEVSLSSSYEAAKQAYNKASNAQDSADNAQNTADDAKDKADQAQESAASAVDKATSVWAKLDEFMSQFVVDETGMTSITQTSGIWQLNMTSISKQIIDAVADITALIEKDTETDLDIQTINDLLASLNAKTAYITMSTDSSGSPCIELGKSDSAFKVRITNTSVDFMEGSSKIAYINNQSLYIKRAVIEDELQQGGWVWKVRDNGNYSLMWRGGE